MRKLLLILGILLISSTTVFAAKIPDEVREYIIVNVPGTNIRFDGVIVLPDNTIYLPLYPALFSDINKLKIKETFPAKKDLSQKPDIVIFNNDFVLMKILEDENGTKTVLHQATPPLQVRTGLLPQDMLVPSGLIIPENLKGIIGNLKIDTKSEDLIKSTTKESYEEFLADTEPDTDQVLIPQLKNKTLFVTTNYSKNIQIIEPPKASPSYSLLQKSIPINIKDVDYGNFILVTSYERPYLDVISVADSRFIKHIDLGTNPEEILVDSATGKAYISSPTVSTIYVVDLNTMSLVQKIKVNGYCEKLILSEDKLFYVDKLKSEVWSIEMKKGYELKNIGKFPNISSLAFINNKLYIASRTKSRVAVIDYTTLGLESEFTVANKPIAMQIFGKYLYLLGAQNNRIQKINTDNNKIIENIDLGTAGYSTGFNRIVDTNLAVIVDIKTNMYTVFDLAKGKILKTYSLNLPVNDVIITNKVKLFDE